MKNRLKGLPQANLKMMGNIIEQVQVGMLTTYGQSGLPSSRPMYAQEVDEDGTVWFFASKTSSLAQNILESHHVHLTFADSRGNQFLTCWGEASLVEDRNKMGELWNPHLRVWFREGLDTPNITLLRLAVTEAEYWDSPNSPVVKVVGLVKSWVSHTPFNPGRHERVKLSHIEKKAPSVGEEQAP